VVVVFQRIRGVHGRRRRRTGRSHRGRLGGGRVIEMETCGRMIERGGCGGRGRLVVVVEWRGIVRLRFQRERQRRRRRRRRQGGRDRGRRHLGVIAVLMVVLLLLLLLQVQDVVRLLLLLVLVLVLLVLVARRYGRRRRHGRVVIGVVVRRRYRQTGAEFVLLQRTELLFAVTALAARRSGQRAHFARVIRGRASDPRAAHSG